MSLTKFVFVVVIASLAAVNAEECGKKSINRIVGGIDAQENEFPWQVSWRYYNKTTQTDRHICGGSIIGKKWIVTAAHCVDLNSDVSTIDVTNFRALLGEHSLGTVSPNEVKLNIIKIVVHPNWDSKTINNDLALCELERELDLDGAESHLKTICLANAAHPSIEGQNVVISGWGLTKYQGDTLPDILQRAVVPCVTQSSCKSAYQFINPITDAMICAGGSNIGVCQGDSGGPLQYEYEGSWYLAGATSWGVGCAWVGFPGVFARITYFLKFIETTTGIAPK